MDKQVPKSLYGYATFKTKPQKEDLLPQTKYIIEYQIQVTKEEFEDLINNPLDDKKFIIENKETMFTDNKGIWHCLLVTCEGYNYGILIDSEGYDYARYAALITL